MDADWCESLTGGLSQREIDLDDLLQRALDRITADLGADRATIYMIDHASGMLVSRVAHLPEIAEIRLRIGEGIAGHVARNGKVMHVRRGSDDSRIARRIDEVTGYRTECLLAVPVFDRDANVIAVLELLNKRDGDFEASDIELLETCAARLSELLFRTSLGAQLGPNQTQPLAYRFNRIVGTSAPMQAIYDLTARASRTDVTVLIRGESGTGKDLFARAVHYNSPRADGPFVKVDCAALPEKLIENELFGHEKGAFTGADSAAEGKVDVAVGGTLMLDEVGEMPLSVQGKLLRLLQDRTYLRVGGTRELTADVRFVCATNRDLEQAVRDGEFREDLYYRLHVVELDIPPLRDRGHADVDRLVDHFLAEFSRRHERLGLRLEARARNALHAHDWPGNVRELENCIESAVVLAPGDVIDVDQLRIRPPLFLDRDGGLPPHAFVTGIRPLREVELDYILHVLETEEGNRSAAARTLEIGRNTLLRKLAQEDTVD